MNVTLRRFLPLACLLLLLGGCANLIDTYFLPTPEDTAQELYEAGRDAMSQKQYYDAIDYFTKLKDRYPFSPYTPMGTIALADAYFLTEDYGPASETYKEFESVHPRSEEIPYVLYQIGVSNFKRSESIDMPQNNLQEALQYFYLLEQTFPDTEYGKEAKDYIRRCRMRLAEHELFVADFYWRTGQYGAAWKRYMYTVENFKELQEVVSYASLRAQLSYLEYQKTVSEEERRQIQGSWRNWAKRWL
ncbi:MAG: outer membrane protein assembly factor BamD [Desulfovibrionaceae bacterium]